MCVSVQTFPSFTVHYFIHKVWKSGSQLAISSPCLLLLCTCICQSPNARLSLEPETYNKTMSYSNLRQPKYDCAKSKLKVCLSLKTLLLAHCIDTLGNHHRPTFNTFSHPLPNSYLVLVLEPIFFSLQICCTVLYNPPPRDRMIWATVHWCPTWATMCESE